MYRTSHNRKFNSAPKQLSSKLLLIISKVESTKLQIYSHQTKPNQTKMKFVSIRSPRDKIRRSISTESAVSQSSSSSSAESSKRNKHDFVANSMKEMDSHRVIEMLEIYAAGDNEYAYQCFQRLKNSEPATSRKSSPSGPARSRCHEGSGKPTID